MATKALKQQHGVATKVVAPITDIWKRYANAKYPMLDKRPECLNETATESRAPTVGYSLKREQEVFPYQQQYTSTTHNEYQTQDKSATSPIDMKPIDTNIANETQERSTSAIATPKQYHSARQCCPQGRTSHAPLLDRSSCSSISSVCPLVVERIGWPNGRQFPRTDESSSTDKEPSWTQQRAKNNERITRMVFMDKSRMEICVLFDQKSSESDDKSSETSPSTSDTDEGRRSKTVESKRRRTPRKYQRRGQSQLMSYCRQHWKQDNAITQVVRHYKSHERGHLKTIHKQHSQERKRNFDKETQCMEITKCDVALETDMSDINVVTKAQEGVELERIKTTTEDKLTPCKEITHCKRPNHPTVYPVALHTIKKRAYTRQPVSRLGCKKRRYKNGRSIIRRPLPDMLSAITRLTQVCQEHAGGIDQPKTKPTKKQPYRIVGNSTKQVKRIRGDSSYYVGRRESSTSTSQEHVRANVASTPDAILKTTKPVCKVADWTYTFKGEDGIRKRDNITKPDDVNTKYKALTIGCNNNSNCIVLARMETDSGRSTLLFSDDKPHKGKQNVADAPASSKGGHKHISPTLNNAFVSLQDTCRPRATGLVKPKAKPVKRLTCSPLFSSKTKVATKRYIDVSCGSNMRVKTAAQQYYPQMDIKPKAKLNTSRKQGSSDTERKQVITEDVQKRKHPDVSSSSFIGKDTKSRSKYDVFAAPQITRKTITGLSSSKKYTMPNKMPKPAVTHPSKLRTEATISPTIRRNPITPSSSTKKGDHHADRPNAKPRIRPSAEHKKLDISRDRGASYRRSVRHAGKKHDSNAFYRLLANNKCVSYGIHTAGNAFQQLVPSRSRAKHCHNAAEILAVSPLVRQPPPKMHRTESLARNRSHYVDMKPTQCKNESGTFGCSLLPGVGSSAAGQWGYKPHNMWSFWSPSVSNESTATDPTADVSVPRAELVHESLFTYLMPCNA